MSSLQTELLRNNVEFFKFVANPENIITKRNKNEMKQPVSWLRIQWIRIRKEEPYVVFYKETLNSNACYSFLENLYYCQICIFSSYWFIRQRQFPFFSPNS